MLLNGIELTDRYNRPSVLGRTALRIQFFDDGVPKEPFDVSSCTVFSKLTNASPNSIVDETNGLIKAAQPISTVLMNFAISGDPLADPALPHDGLENSIGVSGVTQNYLNNVNWFPPYAQAKDASGIYRTGETGEYVAVLDGGEPLSGVYGTGDGGVTGGTVIKNGASSVQDYIDVWTVRMVADSGYQLFINSLKLYNDNFVGLVEPLVITPSNRLVNKHIVVGSNTDLKVTTELTVGNKNLDESIKNIIKNYGLKNASYTIQKVNEDSVSLPAREDHITNASVGVSLTSNNTILIPFDATLTALGGLQGGPVGTYVLTVVYNFLTQTIVTPPFYFTVN